MDCGGLLISVSCLPVKFMPYLLVAILMTTVDGALLLGVMELVFAYAITALGSFLMVFV